MEVTRAHLQKELRTREMECERLKVHIKVVKSVEVLNMTAKIAQKNVHTAGN